VKKNNSKTVLSGSQIIINTLTEQGTTDVFGYPGSAVINIYDELYNSKDRLRHILFAHEQGAAFAADGYSRVTGKVGVVIATSGPGATNLVTGIAAAMLDSVPMVIITGNVATSQIGKDSFQEINITGITMPITKHNYFVTDVCELAEIIREAFRIAKSGRPGPVLIDVPKDVQTASCEYIPQPVVEPFEQDKVSEADIDRAVELISESDCPYIYVGGGAAGASMTQDIMALAEKIDAYIGSSFMGLSALPNSYPRFLGMQGMHGRYASSMANKAADLIIGVGVRFSDRATGNVAKYVKRTSILQLDADISEINKNVHVDVGLVGDMVDAFRRITEKCRPQKHPEWQAKVEDFKAEGRRIYAHADNTSTTAIPPNRVFEVINRIKDDNTVIATDVGQHQMWTAQYIHFERTRRFASSGGLGAMGYGLGAAIGAHIGSGDRVVLITGDGSFAMNSNELATAVYYNIPVTVVLMNNGVLGMVRQWQTLFFDKRYSSTVLDRRTDNVKLAEAYGARAVRISDIAEFESAFREAMSHNGPYLIEVPIDKDEYVLPMLPPGGSMDDLIVTLDPSDKEEKQWK